VNLVVLGKENEWGSSGPALCKWTF